MDSEAPSAPPPPTPSARYAYLVARLRNRQITMNEATELFELQQSTLSAALARVQGMPAATPPTSAPPTPSSSPGTPSPSPSSVDDAFWMGLLAAGAGAGLIAAVLKRARDGAEGSGHDPARPPPGR